MTLFYTATAETLFMGLTQSERMKQSSVYSAMRCSILHGSALSEDE